MADRPESPPTPSHGGAHGPMGRSHSASWFKVRLETLTATQTYVVVLLPFVVLGVAIFLDWGG